MGQVQAVLGNPVVDAIHTCRSQREVGQSNNNVAFSQEMMYSAAAPTTRQQEEEASDNQSERVEATLEQHPSEECSAKSFVQETRHEPSSPSRSASYMRTPLVVVQEEDEIAEQQAHQYNPDKPLTFFTPGAVSVRPGEMARDKMSPDQLRNILGYGYDDNESVTSDDVEPARVPTANLEARLADDRDSQYYATMNFSYDVKQEKKQDNNVVGRTSPVRERDMFYEKNGLTQAIEISEDLEIPVQRKYSASSSDSDADVMNKRQPVQRPVTTTSNLKVQDGPKGLSTLDEVMRQSPKSAQRVLNDSISTLNWE